MRRRCVFCQILGRRRRIGKVLDKSLVKSCRRHTCWFPNTFFWPQVDRHDQKTFVWIGWGVGIWVFQLRTEVWDFWEISVFPGKEKENNQLCFHLVFDSISWWEERRVYALGGSALKEAFLLKQKPRWTFKIMKHISLTTSHNHATNPVTPRSYTNHIFPQIMKCTRRFCMK